MQSDFLLIILKEILQKRSDLHLILMSATVDSEKFSAYFTHCPILRISGRSYPVEVRFLYYTYVKRNCIPTRGFPPRTVLVQSESRTTHRVLQVKRGPGDILGIRWLVLPWLKVRETEGGFCRRQTWGLWNINHVCLSKSPCPDWRWLPGTSNSLSSCSSCLGLSSWSFLFCIF